MGDYFLGRFLSNISEGTPPSLKDLKLIADALIQMHDYGVSFKTAFDLADKRGRKPKNSKNTLRSDSFQLMKSGFLGNPIYLCRFISTVEQGRQPKIKDLQRVANALLKMRDEDESLASAFGMRQKTGHKQLDITQIPFGELVRHEKWIIYYAYEKYRKTKNHEDTRALINENILVKKQVKGAIREIHYSTRQIEQIVSDVRKRVDIYALPIKIKRREIWKIYFSNRKYLLKSSILEAIENISLEAQRDEWGICLELADLYEEVVTRKKYAPITRGTRDYPRRVVARLEIELKPVYELVMSVHALNSIDQFLIRKIYKAQIGNFHGDIIEAISKQLHIEPMIIDGLLKSCNRPRLSGETMGTMSVEDYDGLLEMFDS